MLPPASNLYSPCRGTPPPQRKEYFCASYSAYATCGRSPLASMPVPFPFRPLTEKAAVDQGEPSLPTSAAAPFLPSVEGSAIYPHASLPHSTPIFRQSSPLLPSSFRLRFLHTLPKYQRRKRGRPVVIGIYMRGLRSSGWEGGRERRERNRLSALPQSVLELVRGQQGKKKGGA